MVRHFLLLLIWTIVLPMQAQVTLRASASQQELNQNDRLRVVFEIDNAAGQNFRPPRFDNFEVLSGPNQGSNTTIINGTVSRSARISYDLLASTPGTFVIEPAQLEVGGKQIRSNSLTIRVKEVDQTQMSKGLDSEAEVQLRLKTRKDTVYVGEELRLEIELINRVNFRTYSVIRPLETNGIRSENLRNFNNFERRIEIDGKPYLKRTIQALSLFPNRPGTYEIGPMMIQANVIDGENRTRGFFFTPRTRPVDAISNALELTVLPLPTPAPEGFIGAAGNWRIQGQYDDLANMTTADALTFKLFVQGQGDAGRLQAPELNWPEGWRAYPPETTTDHSVETDTGLVHTRVYQYTVAPVKGGTFNLRPKASFFSADSGRYETWSMQAQTVAVRDVGTNLTHPSDGLEGGLFVVEGKPKPVAPLWIDQSWFWWTIGLMPMLFMLVWAGKKAIDRRKTDETKELADPIAEGKRRLQKARASIADPGKFYQEVREALQQYAEDRLGLPPSQQSRAEILSAFAKTTGGVLQGEKFMEASALADRGLYGGGTDEEGRRTALAELERLLSE